MTDTVTIPNPDLLVVAGNKPCWSHADHRRHGWHNLHKLARYCTSYRAARVMTLEKRMDLWIAELPDVRHQTSLPWFSAMIVTQGQHILFERYAADFGPSAPHSIQSITKTTMNLVIGRLVDRGVLDLSHKIKSYIPEIGSGYAEATLQQVLNMDVVNEYSEDFTDPHCSYYLHEEAMGWRLPRDPAREESQREFVRQIKSADTENRSGFTQYKDANTDLLGWVAERASGIPIRALLADIVDAAGIEGSFHITTDREGIPSLAGGACLTARDLARYFSLFARGGRGVGDELVGSEAFVEQTMLSGVPRPEPYESFRYSNHAMVSDRTLGHGGWGGEYAMVNLDTGRVGIFLSVVEDEHAATRGHLLPIIRMLESIVGAGS
jgi:CubicO group peptidase (beta-lactamase class C family)